MSAVKKKLLQSRDAAPTRQATKVVVKQWVMEIAISVWRRLLVDDGNEARATLMRPDGMRILKSLGGAAVADSETKISKSNLCPEFSGSRMM